MAPFQPTVGAAPERQDGHWGQARGGWAITRDIGWDPVRQRMIRQTRTRYADRMDAVCTSSSVRLYTPAELLAMLGHAGLHVDATFSSYRGQALADGSDRIIIIGHRP